MPFAQQGGAGQTTPDGSARVLALPGTGETTFVKVSAKDGSLLASQTLPGSLGLPMLTYSEPASSFSRDGRFLVVAGTTVGSPTRFAILWARDLTPQAVFSLHGVFAFDALSPDGTRLYLIQHRSVRALDRYVVREYSIPQQRLLPGRVADRAQRSWVMQGYPVDRASTADGRWVYTLYQNPGGTPFVHALDTVRGVARCVGIPWTGSDQTALANVVLAVRGRTLALRWRSGAPWLALDTRTWRIGAAAGERTWPWFALAAGVVAAVGLLLLWRRRRRQEVAQELRDALGLAEREVVV